MSIYEQVAEEFGGAVIDSDCVKFTCCGSDFCLTDGTLYLQIDDRFAGSGKKVKTMAAVKKFVELRK